MQHVFSLFNAFSFLLSLSLSLFFSISASLPLFSRLYILSLFYKHLAAAAAWPACRRSNGDAVLERRWFLLSRSPLSPFPLLSALFFATGALSFGLVRRSHHMRLFCLIYIPRSRSLSPSLSLSLLLLLLCPTRVLLRFQFSPLPFLPSPPTLPLALHLCLPSPRLTSFPFQGEYCPFRHSIKAQLNPTVCTAWMAGHCYDPDCRFRHYQDNTDRSTTPCYWETQPSGCTKMHCPFFHVKRTSSRLGAISAPAQKRPATAAATATATPGARAAAPAATKGAAAAPATAAAHARPPVTAATSTSAPSPSPHTPGRGSAPAAASVSGGRRMPSATSLVAAKLKSEPHKGPATGTPVGRNSILARVGREKKGAAAEEGHASQRQSQEKRPSPPARPSIHARLGRQQEESADAGKSVQSRLRRL